MDTSHEVSVKVLYSWTCTKLVMHPWDDVRQTSISVEYDGSQYLVVERREGWVVTNGVKSFKNEETAVSYWVNCTKLMTPKPLFPKAQVALPGMGGDVASYKVVEKDSSFGGRTWEKFLP
jgi:hypothetical protein